MPEKKRRKRDGYDEGDYTLHKTISAIDFIHNPDAVSLLGTANQITFGTSDEKEWLKLGITRPEIKANCDDLKVLGKGDFKSLIRWRSALREEVRHYCIRLCKSNDTSARIRCQNEVRTRADGDSGYHRRLR
jgi:AdoMet-dependent rRNA methyltransferase SPB1